MLGEADELDWKTNKAIKLMASLRKYAQGVVEEILGTKWSYGSLNHNGVFLPKYHQVFDGPITKEYLDVFSAKLAMSAFKEFIGRYVDIKGRIYTEWFLNYTTIYDGLKDITEALPDQVSMNSGKGIESPQFTINYQTDCKSIVIGLAKFHNNAAIAFAITDHEEAVSILETFDLGRPTEHNTDALFIERFVNKAKL